MTAVERMYPDDDQISPETIRHHKKRYEYAITHHPKIGPALDLACGSGYGTEALRTAGFMPATGVDISEEALVYAKENFPKCDFAVADLATYNPQESYFSIVTFFEAIEHVSREVGIRSLEIINKALVPDGIAFISTPRDIRSDVNPFHITQWTSKELEDELGKLFSDVQLLGQDWATGVIDPNRETHHAFFFAVCKK